MGLMGFSLIRVFVKVVNIPKEILIPIIFTLTFCRCIMLITIP